MRLYVWPVSIGLAGHFYYGPNGAGIVPTSVSPERKATVSQMMRRIMSITAPAASKIFCFLPDMVSSFFVCPYKQRYA